MLYTQIVFKEAIKTLENNPKNSRCLFDSSTGKIVFKIYGNLKEAETQYLKAIDLARKINNPILAILLNNLGLVYKN